MEDSKKALRRAQWLRAAILGANDGLVSTTSLMLGVGAAKEDRQSMVLSGLAGALAGALSMAVGEFVSVSTQRDIEEEANRKLGSLKSKPGLDLDRLQEENIKITINAESRLSEPISDHQGAKTKMKTDNNSSLVSSEFRNIEQDAYNNVKSPGRSSTLRVVVQDANKIDSETPKKVGDAFEGKGETVESHDHLPNPYKAAASSALSFLLGSLVPLVSAVFVVQDKVRIAVVAAAASLAMVVFGAIGAYLGGSPVAVSAMRVLFGGWVAMGVTYGMLKPFDRDHNEEKT